MVDEIIEASQVLKLYTKLMFITNNLKSTPCQNKH